MLFRSAKTPRWEVLLYPSDAKEFELPHRLFHPFSFEHNDDAEYEAVLDFAAKTAFPVRGTKPFPDKKAYTTLVEPAERFTTKVKISVAPKAVERAGALDPPAHLYEAGHVIV
mgnify:CR=1 FL=1